VRALDAVLWSSIHSLAGSFANGSYITSVMKTSPCAGFGAPTGGGGPVSGTPASATIFAGGFFSGVDGVPVPASSGLSFGLLGDGVHDASSSGSEGSVSGVMSPVALCAQPHAKAVVIIGAQNRAIVRWSEHLMQRVPFCYAVRHHARPPRPGDAGETADLPFGVRRLGA
jgi:hypothetical protein